MFGDLIDSYRRASFNYEYTFFPLLLQVPPCTSLRFSADIDSNTDHLILTEVHNES